MNRMNEIPLISWDSDPLTEQEVTVVENTIGRLPADYRRFLLSRNGGRTLDEEVRFPDPENAESYVGLTEFEVIDPKFPPTVLTTRLRWTACRLLKIATSYESPILMQLNGRDTGTVYLWFWTLENLWDAQDAGKQYLPKLSSLRKLASNFTDFVNRLVRVNSEQTPNLKEMDRSVENFAKYGDHCFGAAKEFFDKLTIDELNQCWPKGDENPLPAIWYAAGWSQIRICKYLINRGVDIHIHPGITRCSGNYEIAKMIIQAGATDEELRRLLYAAAYGIASTRVPEQNAKVVMHLVECGIQPDFANLDVLNQWTQGIDAICTKKMLSFLLGAIPFPSSIADLIRDKLSKPGYDRLAK